MDSKKRVYCLYRVSRTEQVENDDIPVQRQACRDFAERQGWEIVQEYLEKGVSGFKVSSQKRDAILEIQREAALGNFEILLVFMFDRLGRRDDETPFVVEWFVRHNIAVWSVNEGEQRLDSHVDKLLNYIRYWQASGESVKTSIRCKAGIAQIVSEGHYAGGPAPFGYRLEKSGRVNTKKGTETLDYVVDDESKVELVRTIFNKYVNEGYGSIRLVRYLYDLGVVKANGKPFSQCNVQKLLTNELYIGYLVYGDNRMFVPRLQIIDNDIFDRAQVLRKQRRKFEHVGRRVPMTTKGASLLSGNIFCGHCGGRMHFSNGNVKYRKANGEMTQYNAPGYICISHRRGTTTCQQKYSTKKIDDIVRSVLRDVFAQIRETPPTDSWKRQHERILAGTKTKLKAATRNAVKLDKELLAYKGEVLKVIQGDSAFTAEILSQLISDTETKKSEQAIEIERLKSELDESSDLYKKEKGEHMRIRSWSEIFDESSIETQKMAAASLIHEVRVTRGYQIEIDFNLSAKEFVEGISFDDENLNVSVEN